MSEWKIDQSLDLSGDVCPMTFVKSKLALEEMDPDQILEVIVDNAESASNVPQSMQLEGYEVLSVDTVPRGWRIVVKS